MQAFAAELRRFSRKHSLLELECKDHYKKNRHDCEFRKNVKHDVDGRWTICTHSTFDKSPYTWACMLDHCPFISLGMQDAYKSRAEQRKRDRNERKRLAQ